MFAKMEAGVNIATSVKSAGQTINQADEEFRRIQEREDNQDLAANSVIRKFNTNSERILNLLTKQKKTEKAKDFIMESMDRKDRQQMEMNQTRNVLLTEDVQCFDSLYRD